MFSYSIQIVAPSSDSNHSTSKCTKKVFLIRSRVATLHYGSPSYRVVEQQLLIPGFLPEFLETSGDQENLSFLEKVATINIKEINLQSLLHHLRFPQILAKTTLSEVDPYCHIVTLKKSENTRIGRELV